MLGAGGQQLSAMATLWRTFDIELSKGSKSYS